MFVTLDIILWEKIVRYETVILQGRIQGEGAGGSHSLPGDDLRFSIGSVFDPPLFCQSFSSKIPSKTRYLQY